MVIAAAEEAAHADALIGECRYDDAERWIQEAARTARDTRSESPLVRDIAGSAVGRMNIKLEDFRRQRKAWDRATADARHLLAANHLDMARTRLDQVVAPTCDQRFAELRGEIENRDERATELVRKGDDELPRAPLAARDDYFQARTIDPDRPGLQQKLLDAENRIPGPCVACGFKKVGKVVLWTAIAGGLGYGGYLAYEHRQQVNGFSH